MATVDERQTAIRGGSPTIFISDMDRAVQFYTEVLGLRLAERAGDHFALIDAGAGFMLGLHPPAKNAAAPGTSGSIQVGLKVTAPIRDVIEQLEARGVTFDAGGGDAVVDDGDVKLAFFADPDGTELYLFEVA